MPRKTRKTITDEEALNLFRAHTRTLRAGPGAIDKILAVIFLILLAPGIALIWIVAWASGKTDGLVHYHGRGQFQIDWFHPVAIFIYCVAPVLSLALWLIGLVVILAA
jgi:hypothetical protein